MGTEAGPRILLLGGTSEAMELANLLSSQSGGLRVVTSLAGRTRNPAPVPGQVRRGGFGGAAAMADYLRDEWIAAVIDATHPFAAQISANAAQACEQTGVPRLLLRRPEWLPVEGDNWIICPDMAAAAAKLPGTGSRAFLTVGVQELAAFSGLADIRFLVRLIEKPEQELPLAEYELVIGRGPFDEAGEQALLKKHGIDVLVTKASGGAATQAKLAAARALGLPVIMVERPPVPPGPAVETPAEALNWLRKELRS